MREFYKDLLKSRPINQYIVYGLGVVWIVVIFLGYITIQDYRVRRHYNKAYRYFHQQNTEATLRELKTTLSIDPDFAEAYNLLGKIALHARDYSNASDYFQSLIGLTGGSPEARNGLAVTQIVRRHLPGTAVDPQAKQMLLDLASGPGARMGDLFVNLGSIALHEADLPAAEKYYQTALATRNVRIEGLAHVYNGLGVLRVKQASLETGERQTALLRQAEIEFTKAQLVSPASPDVVTNRFLMRLALMVGKPWADPARRGVLREAAEFMKSRGGDVRPSLAYLVHNDLGLQAYKEMRFPDAIDEFVKAAQVDPLAYVPAFNLGVTRLAIAEKELSPNAVDDARDIVARLIDSTRVPQMLKVSLLAHLSAIECRAGERDDAHKHLDEVIKLAKGMAATADLAAAYRTLAILEYDEGNYDKAIEATHQAMQADPTMTDLQKIIDILKLPPRVTKPEVLRYESFLPDLQPLRAEVHSEAVPDLIDKEKIDVTIDGKPAEFEFGEASTIYILPRERLGDGVHGVRVQATDKLGNKAEATGEIKIDVTPPIVYALSPPADSTLKPGTQDISVELQDGISGIDFSTLKLTVTLKGADGKPDAYPIVRLGKSQYNVQGVMTEGEPIWNEKFVFQLKSPFVAGDEYTFTLSVDDKRGNRLKEYQWKYTVKE